MKRTAALVFAIAVASAAYADPPMTQDEAFSQGKTAGDTAANQAIFDSISAAKGAEVMPSYTPSAPASSYWNPSAVVGAQITGGLNKIVDCEGIPSTDPATKNHCEAVRAIKNQPFIKPPGLITATDPLIVKGDSITNDPEAIVGVMTGTYTACTVETQNLGKEKTTESCDEYPTTGNESCTIGAQVTVDADHLLKCLDSVEVTANSSCTVGRVIQVDADSNYQCAKTELAHETLTCNKTVVVTSTAKYQCSQTGIQFPSAGDCAANCSTGGMANFVILYFIGGCSWGSFVHISKIPGTGSPTCPSSSDVLQMVAYQKSWSVAQVISTLETAGTIPGTVNNPPCALAVCYGNYSTTVAGTCSSVSSMTYTIDNQCVALEARAL